MREKSFLLPRGFKFSGIILIIAGTLLGFIRFKFGIKPDLLAMKPFAFWSSYLEPKYLQFIGNNMSEEVVSLFLFLGLFFVAFSRDKNENKLKSALRNRALIYTIYFELIVGITAILFTFGFAFMYSMIVNLFLPFAIYIIIFRFLLFMDYQRRKKITSGNSSK